MNNIEHSDGIYRFVAVSLNFLYRLVMWNSQIRAAKSWLYPCVSDTPCARMQSAGQELCIPEPAGLNFPLEVLVLDLIVRVLNNEPFVVFAELLRPIPPSTAPLYCRHYKCTTLPN
jgi:hypothetical protein